MYIKIIKYSYLGPFGPFWDPWPLFIFVFWTPLGPFGTLGPDYERFFMKLCSFGACRKLSGKAGSFLERQEAFWKSRKLLENQNGSGNPEWFWKARMVLKIQNGSGKSRIVLTNSRMILENPEWFWKIWDDSGKPRMVLENPELFWNT